MAKVGIIDCDLLSRKNHRFPNLACMKISAYYKSKGHDTSLIKSWDEDLSKYDRICASKVFTDTYVPEIRHDNVAYGGTGFLFDKAPPLPYRIEHMFPDYTLYYDYIKQFPYSRKLRKQFEAYIDYSIGFLTRGCFRKCKFCVNQNYDRVNAHSSLKEFYDPSRKIICMLDDNFLGCPDWKGMLLELQATGKRFVFKQGLDERLLTDEKCAILFNSRYYDDYIFAFDNVKDYDLIERKLKLIRRYTDTRAIMFYVLTGFEGTDAQDIGNAFKRIKLLFDYGCFPYLMRYQNKDYKPYEHSEWRSLYIGMAKWANQRNIVSRMSFREFYERLRALSKTGKCSYADIAEKFEKEHPEIAKEYFDVKWKKWNG